MLGKYELVKHIARGGMSDVYEARIRGIGGFETTVAVKRMRPDLSMHREMVNLFLEEARLWGKLQHPNIAQVYDLGMVDGSYFLAMEYVRGVDVRWMLQHASNVHPFEIPPDVVVAIALGVLSGLHYLHEQLDVVHRDISPSNVMVGADGCVKLIDFGIALPRAAQDGRVHRFASAGKRSYMSPEQCLGWVLDRRTDIFSTSILLWELSVLHKLFHGRDDVEVMQRIVQEDAMPPSMLRPSYPAELERIVMRGLRRYPNARYRTADQMRKELEDFAYANRLDPSTGAVSRYLESALASV